MDNTFGHQSLGRPSAAAAFEGLSPEDDVVVSFNAVGMRYGRAPEVLTDLSFELRRGSFQFLTGASGAGKSSLLSLIYLGNSPSRGLIHLFGQDISRLSRAQSPAIRRQIGVAYEDTRLLDHLDAFDNVALPLRLAGAPPRAWRGDVMELLAWFGLADRAHALPATLSGGERKRLALARAVVARPRIILADEPTNHLDPAMGRKVMKLLAHLADQGSVVLVATHDVNLVVGSGKPVLHLDEGRLTHYPQGVE